MKIPVTGAEVERSVWTYGRGRLDAGSAKPPKESARSLRKAGDRDEEEKQEREPKTEESETGKFRAVVHK